METNETNSPLVERVGSNSRIAINNFDLGCDSQSNLITTDKELVKGWVHLNRCLESDVKVGRIGRSEHLEYMYKGKGHESFRKINSRIISSELAKRES